MVLPIYAYGQPVLKKVAVEIDHEFPELSSLIANMWETMYHAKGVGLAAPQIGQSIRLFIVDTAQLDDEDESESKGIKQVFINAQKINEDGEPWDYEEGCLSIPNIRAEVERPEKIRLSYLNESFELKEEVFEGMNARVIQHEYDHIDGVLFTDHIRPIKRRLLNRKLDQIRKGKASADYTLRFAKFR